MENEPINIIKQKIKEGKIKFGVCEISWCNNKGYLYKVTNAFICGECLNNLEKIIKELGMTLDEN